MISLLRESILFCRSLCVISHEIASSPAEAVNQQEAVLLDGDLAYNTIHCLSMVLYMGRTGPRTTLHRPESI